MPKIVQTNIKCPQCRSKLPDRGKGKTCPECGFSPVPSYDYPRDSAFHPLKLSKVAEQQERIKKAVRRNKP